VKKGDTLSTIASRNGTTVSAIKSANRISGTMIRDGQKLIIPKR
jgi:peptidoglycan endopeptidase LytF